MLSSHFAVVRNGRIELSDAAALEEGARLVVTVLSPNDEFWLHASQSSAVEIWDNEQDDTYGELLKT